MKSKVNNALFYGIVDLGYVPIAHVEIAAQSLIKGGAGVIQLRAKGVELDEIERLAKLLVPICREAEVPFIVNDYPEIAKKVGADGVHIGQDDGALLEVRKVVGEEMIVGRSTHSPEQANDALLEGFDYIGFGPVFPTPTKKGRPGIGVENIQSVQNTVGAKIPVFCIGGLKRSNLTEVIECGAKRAVVVSDVLCAEDIAQASAEVVEILNK